MLPLILRYYWWLRLSLYGVAFLAGLIIGAVL